MYSYPIWNEVESCIYKSSKSFGARDTSTTTVYVGTSAKNSEALITHFTTRRVEGDYTVFRFGVEYPDGKREVLITKWMHTKTQEWFDTNPAEAA